MAFAEILEQIEGAKNVTWKWTVYWHFTSKDGKRTWLKTETRPKAYKAPGLHRETFVDDQGEVRKIEITDFVQRRRLTVLPGAKEAVLSELVAGGALPAGRSIGQRIN